MAFLWFWCIWQEICWKCLMHISFMKCFSSAHTTTSRSLWISQYLTHIFEKAFVNGSSVVILLLDLNLTCITSSSAYLYSSWVSAKNGQKVQCASWKNFCSSTLVYTSSQCLKITQNVAFEFWHFPSIFVLLKRTCLVTLFDRKLQVFKNSPKWTILGIFN